jgi:transposase
MLSAINIDGRMPTMVFDGTADIAAMLSYLDWLLLPELEPGDVVVMDNLGCHKSSVVVELIRSVGADVRFLPPYSPDWNPIEHIWSKIKSYLAATAAPTGKRLINAIGRALKTISSGDIANCIRHCGYNMNTLS